MRRLELKRITAALRQLTPDQRKSVAVDSSTGCAAGIDCAYRGALRMWRDVPALQVYARDSERPRQRIATLSLSGMLQDV